VSRIFSSLAAIKASFLFFALVKAAKKYFGIDVSGSGEIEQKQKILCMALGEYLTVSASQMAYLAFGMAPIKAAGYAAVAWCALLCRLIFFEKTHKVLGVNLWKQLVILGFAMAYAGGFLLM